MKHLILVLAIIFIPECVTLGEEIPVTSSGTLSYPVDITVVRGLTPVNNATISDFTLYYSCNGGAPVAFNATGDTLTYITNSKGVYGYSSNDVVCTPPATMLVFGFGSALDLDIPSRLINLVFASYADTVCQITAASSGVSFTIGSCLDYKGQSISLASDYFVGMEMEAINRSTTQCNVVGHSVLVDDLTSGGVVTVDTTGLSGGGFPATPNTTNCNVRLK